MNPIIGPNPLEILLLILLGGGPGMPIGVPQGVPPAAEAPLAAKVAPADCIFYASWAGTATPDKNSGNQVEQLLAEPEVSLFVTEARDRLLGLARATSGLQEQAVKDGSRLLELIKTKPGAVFLSDVRFEEGRDQPIIEAGGLVHLGKDLSEAEGLLKRLQEQGDGDVSSVKIGDRTYFQIVIDDEFPPITWGAAGEYLVVGLGEGVIEGLIERARGEAPQWLTTARTNLAVPRFCSMAHLNVKRIVELTVKGSGAIEVEQMVAALGLDQIRDFTTVSGLDDTGMLTRSTLTIEGPGRGLLKWIDSAPLKSDDLKTVTQDSPLAVAFKLDPSWLFQFWIDLVAQMEPRAADQMRRELTQASEFFGSDIQKDVVGSLGDTWMLYVQPGPRAMDVGWTVAVDVRNREKLEQFQKTLIAQVKVAFEQFGGPSLTTETVEGHDIHSLDLNQTGVPLAPSWCLTEDQLFITAFPQAIQQILSAKEDVPTLAAQPNVTPFFQSEARTLAMAYMDTRKVAEGLLPMAPVLIGQLMGPMASSMDTSNLPPSDVILKHLTPSILAVSRTEDGLAIVSRRPLPGAAIETAAPVVAASLLPAIGASRNAARRAQSMNNLKQIGIAMHNFHDVFQAFPAGYSADKEGHPLLSWRVHILPFVEQQALFDEFHLDEPWDSPHNKKLIERMPSVYKAPGSKCKPGMTNYLGVGGADGVFVRPAEGERFKGSPGTSFANITDGTSNTVMIVEASDEQAITWTRPGDYAPDKENPVKGLVGLRRGGFQAAFCDGSVRFISASIDPETLNLLFTKSDGKPVNNY